MIVTEADVVEVVEVAVVVDVEEGVGVEEDVMVGIRGTGTPSVMGVINGKLMMGRVESRRRVRRGSRWVRLLRWLLHDLEKRRNSKDV